MDFNAIRLTNYSSDLQKAEAERKTAEAAYKTATGATDIMSVNEVQDSASVQRLREKIETLTNEKSRVARQLHF